MDAIEQISAPVAALPAVKPIDTSRVTKWVLKYVNDAKCKAEEVSRKHIWDRVDAENRAYGLRDKTIEAQDAGVKAASLDQTYEVKTKDLADQVDEMTALLMDMVDRGEIVKVLPKGDTTEEQAQLTGKVQKSLLAEKDWDDERRKFIGRFVRLCASGLRVCCTHEISYITERVELPVYEQASSIDPYTGEIFTAMVPRYTDGALLEQGYTPDQIKSGEAIRSAVAEQGLTFVGIADLRQDGTYENLLCTKCRETKQDFVFIRAVNPRRLAIADPTRPWKDQPTIHEYSYLTANELRKAHFRNVDGLKTEGSPITDTNEQNPGNKYDSSIDSGRLSVPVYEVCESWLEIPFEQAVLDREFSEEELRAFLIENGVPEEEVQYACYKWVVHHHKDKVLHGIYTSYMLDKSQNPFDGESYIYGDGEFSGNGLMERLSNIAANMLAFLNMTARGVKKNLYGSRIISDRIGLTEAQIKQLDQFGGSAIVEGGLQDVDSEIHVMQYPDVSNTGMSIVSFFREQMRGLGVASILAGEGNAETATQDSINNTRGQTSINEPYRRLARLFARIYKAHLGVMVNRFTTSRYVDILGEDGETMTQRWTMPREVTDNLEFVPAMTFTEGERQKAVQFLMGAMNTVAPVLGPKAVKELLSASMEMYGIDSDVIARIMDAEGTTTSVQQEIEAMLHDPDLRVKVRMEDNHIVCIQMAQIALAQDSQYFAQTGQPQPDRSNVMEYIQIHEGMLEQQRLLESMQAIGLASPQGNETGLQGKPKQARPDGGPGSEEGAARQTGQAVGEGNKGMLSAAGLTGQGSVGLVKGAPAGV